MPMNIALAALFLFLAILALGYAGACTLATRPSGTHVATGVAVAMFFIAVAEYFALHK